MAQGVLSQGVASQDLSRCRSTLGGMTMPDERTRTLIQAGALLKELASDDRVPEAIRKDAERLLRHYPTVSQIRTMALIDQHAGLERYLTPEIDPAWAESYRCGPHLL